MPLTLTRKAGEKIQIGPDIMIEVRQIDRNMVRLTITAPQHVEILRYELLTDEQRLDEDAPPG